jgi:hypothetical protein
LVEYDGYRATTFSYFPLNIANLGKIFTFHELKVVYDRS